MEQLNRIELRGNVGNIRVSTVGTGQVARFSLATNFLYKNKDGEATVETTWHNIVAWSGKGMPEFEKIGKGSPVYVCDTPGMTVLSDKATKSLPAGCQ